MAQLHRLSTLRRTCYNLEVIATYDTLHTIIQFSSCNIRVIAQVVCRAFARDKRQVTRDVSVAVTAHRSWGERDYGAQGDIMGDDVLTCARTSQLREEKRPHGRLRLPAQCVSH
jgi:hypothetical protein